MLNENTKEFLIKFKLVNSNEPISELYGTYENQITIECNELSKFKLYLIFPTLWLGNNLNQLFINIVDVKTNTSHSIVPLELITSILDFNENLESIYINVNVEDNNGDDKFNIIYYDDIYENYEIIHCVKDIIVKKEKEINPIHETDDSENSFIIVNTFYKVLNYFYKCHVDNKDIEIFLPKLIPRVPYNW